jgi:hypothetical protein
LDEKPWQRIVTTLVTVAGIAAIMWMEAPEWQREAIRRATRRRVYRLLHRVARASGRRAMGDELAGRQNEADAGYSFTLRLSQLRDRT